MTMINGILKTRETIEGGLDTRFSMLGNMTAGVGGTSDYNELENKPSINNVTLEGNVSGFDLGIYPPVNYAQNEQLTFSKWLDGKEIWRAVVHLDSLSSTNTVLQNVGTVVRVFGIIYGNSRFANYCWYAPYNDGDYAMFNRTNNNVLQLLIDSWFVNNSAGADIIVEYTKAV